MPAHQRWIILVDLDAFFASVEELLHPDLKGKPIIVGGDPRYRGVVSSASYAARAYGVRSAMPMSQALRLCPQAAVISPRHGKYGDYSRAVMDILNQITPVVEQVSIDEAYLDVTGCEALWGPIEEIGALIQRRVMEEQHLSVSLGIASSKLVAKIACEVGKPRGLVIVRPGEERAFLAPLPIDRLLGVGKVTAARLRSLGIETIGDLAAWDEDHLAQLLGDGARWLHDAARGIDRSEIHTEHEQRSISQERTFARDVGDSDTIHHMVRRMSEEVAAQLRHRGMVAQTVRIKLRYPDFTTLTRQATLDQPTDQEQVIQDQAQCLLKANWREGQLLRLVGVAVSGLIEGGGYQLDLFDHADQRRIRLNHTVDSIRDRYGREAIMRASLLRKQCKGDDDL